MCPYGRVLLFVSNDRGVTWDDGRILTEGPLDDRDAGICELADGTLVVSWFTSVAYERGISDANRVPDAEKAEWGGILTDSERKEWTALRDAMPDARRQQELGCWSIRSTDGGESWSRKVDTVVGSPHGPIVLSDGRMLFCGKLQARDRLKEGRKGSPFCDEMGASESLDGGQTWRELSRIPCLPGHNSAGYHEAHAVEAADGRIVVHMRNHNALHDGEIVQTESFDGGRTWATPHTVGEWGFPAHLMRSRDGRLLSCYGHRRDPRGIRMIGSCDHGVTWSAPCVLSDGAGGDFGYPSTVEMQDGEFLTLWYDRGDDKNGPSKDSLCLLPWKCEWMGL